MSQLTHSVVSFRTAARAHRAVVLAALLALAATAAVVLVLVLASGGSSGEASGTPAATGAQPPGVRYDGGPEEGRYAQPGPSIRYDGGPEEGVAGQSMSGHR
jgi:hypothetical protein